MRGASVERRLYMHIYINTHIHSLYLLKWAFQPKQVVLTEKNLLNKFYVVLFDQNLDCWPSTREVSQSIQFSKILPSGFKFLKAREQRWQTPPCFANVTRVSKQTVFKLSAIKATLIWSVSLWAKNRFSKPCKSKSASYFMQ